MVKCLNCGKEFTLTEHNFCSQLCLLNYYEKENEKYRVKKVCLWCHKTEYMRIEQKYCSRECGCAYNKMRQKIGRLFFNPQFLIEISKLEKEGMAYCLPERIIEDEAIEQ